MKKALPISIHPDFFKGVYSKYTRINSYLKKLYVIGVLISGFMFNLNAQVSTDTIHVDHSGKYDGVEKLIIEKIPVSASVASKDTNLTANHVCYRIFVDMKKDHRFLGFGGSDNPLPYFYLLLETTTKFYNETEFGSTSGKNAKPSLYSVYPQLQYDTYSADGRIGSSHVGVLRSVNSLGYIPITAETTPLADLQTVSAANLIELLTDNQTSRLYDYNSGWAVPGTIPGTDTISNIVFVGQFTTDGEFYFNACISTRDPILKKPRTIRNIAYGFQPEPKVKILSPANDSEIRINTSFDLTTFVKDLDGTVDSVNFYANDLKIDSVVLNSVSSDTLTFNYLIDVAGNQTLMIEAIDNKGNISIDSIMVMAIENVAPLVSILQPVPNAEFNVNSTIPILAEVTDDIAIDSVSFYVDGSKIGNDLESPFEASWIADMVGFHTLKVVAYDNEGLSTESEALSFKVLNNTAAYTMHEKNLLSIYPNPVSDILYLEFNDFALKGRCIVSVFDITGSEILQKSFELEPHTKRVHLDVSNLHPGLYMVKTTVAGNHSAINRININN